MDVVTESLSAALSGKPDLDRAAQHTWVGLLTLDNECRIRHANPAAAAIISMTPADLGGKRFCALFRSSVCDPPAGQSCLFERALRGVERRVQPRWATWGNTGRQQSVLLGATPLWAATRQDERASRGVEGVAVTMVPSALLNESDRRWREMLAAAVHDLRHPITIQSIAGEMLTANLQGNSSDEVRNLLGKLRHSTASMKASVDDLLNRVLFDLDVIALRPQQIALHALLEHLIWNLEPLLQQRRQTVALRIPTSLMVWADAVALEHAMVNLILNAHKYSTDGDTIVVTARQELTKGRVVVQIRDHGPGIPRTERRRVFERYYRGAQVGARQGAGLGLSIVWAIVAQHGGAIAVRSARGGGALFSIQLPMQSASAGSEIG